VDRPIPKVLLTTAYHWPTTARLAVALSEAGLAVEAVCPKGHPLARMTCVTRSYPYGALTPLRHVRNAINVSNPDLIIPCDDTSAAQLHALYNSANGFGSEDEKIRSLVARSLGNPIGYPSFYSRSEIAAAANAVGVLSPATKNLQSYSDLADQIAELGLPAVLKIDGSFGGMGVEIVYTRAEAERAFARLGSYNSLTRAIKRLIVDRDANVVMPGVRRTRPQISIQRFLSGERANSAVACWNGTVLAQVCVEVTASREVTGPASVDAEWVWAWPKDSHSLCPHDKSMAEPPVAERSVFVSLGSNAKPEPLPHPAESAMTSNHVYTYKIVGQGAPAVFVVNDHFHRDNYGQLQITVTPPSAAP